MSPVSAGVATVRSCRALSWLSRRRELTQTGKTLDAHGVTIIGAINLAISVPYHGSQMYARNLATFIPHLLKEGKLVLDLEDEITRETLITRDGDIVNPRARETTAPN